MELSVVESNNNNSQVLDVLIVGAGLAGMSAAHFFRNDPVSSKSNNHLTFFVVEALESVGGRTKNLKASWNDTTTDDDDDDDDDAIDLGGTWVSPSHTALIDLCEQLDLELFRASFPSNSSAFCDTNKSEESQTQNKDTMEEYPWWYWGPDYSTVTSRRSCHDVKRKTVFHSSQGKFIFDNPKVLLGNMRHQVLKELEMAGQYLERLVRENSSALGDLVWNTSSPSSTWKTWDQFSTSALLFSFLRDEEAQNILRNVIHNKNAQEPSSVGFLFNLLSFRGCNSQGPDNELRIRGGSQAVSLAVARCIGRHRLSLGDPVARIEVTKDTTDHPIRVVLESGREFLAKSVILTGSPPAILSLNFNPPLPSLHAQLLQRMPMGTSRKVMAIYKSGPWWRQHGLSGDILASILPNHLSTERLPIFGQCFDTTTFSQRLGVITCFVEGKQNLFYSTLPEAEQIRLFKDFLNFTFYDLVTNQTNREAKPWEPDEIYQYNWADNPFARGAYTAYFVPGVLSVPEFWRAYRQEEKLPNIFLAGSDYHAGFGNGYMEGAVRSGKRAALLVRDRIIMAQKVKVAQ